MKMFYVALVPGAHRQGGEVAAPRRGAKGAKANADQSREGLPEKEEKTRRLTDFMYSYKVPREYDVEDQRVYWS